MPRKPRTAMATKADCDRATTLVRARCGELDFNASTVAAELLCSRRQLQRILAIHGTCFRVELAQARMERGARKLVETRSIATASSLSGYQHRRHFSTAFRTYHGVTPGDVIFAAHLADLLTSLDLTSPLEPARWAHLHRLLLLTLGQRNRGTVLDALFADVIAMRAPHVMSGQDRHSARTNGDSAGTARISPLHGSPRVTTTGADRTHAS